MRERRRRDAEDGGKEEEEDESMGERYREDLVVEKTSMLHLREEYSWVTVHL